MPGYDGPEPSTKSHTWYSDFVVAFFNVDQT